MEFVGNVHVVAGGEADIPQLLELLREQGMAAAGDPDLYTRAYRTFGIDEARELSERAAMRALGPGSRIFIIAADALTHEAQNALLKTIEEPAGNALFVFIVPSPMQLLPTLRSRAQMLFLPKSRTVLDVVDAQAFLKAMPAKRLDMLKPLLEKGDDEKRDLGAIMVFLASVEHALAHRPASLPALYRARKYIGDRGALVKPLLEQVALLI